MMNLIRCVALQAVGAAGEMLGTNLMCFSPALGNIKKHDFNGL
jgi:hypothetical protein